MLDYRKELSNAAVEVLKENGCEGRVTRKTAKVYNMKALEIAYSKLLLLNAIDMYISDGNKDVVLFIKLLLKTLKEKDGKIDTVRWPKGIIKEFLSLVYTDLFEDISPKEFAEFGYVNTPKYRKQIEKEKTKKYEEELAMRTQYRKK